MPFFFFFTVQPCPPPPPSFLLLIPVSYTIYTYFIIYIIYLLLIYLLLLIIIFLLICFSNFIITRSFFLLPLLLSFQQSKTKKGEVCFNHQDSLTEWEKCDRTVITCWDFALRLEDYQFSPFRNMDRHWRSF